MKASLNWLNDHLDLSGKTTDELSNLLTFAGIEVEGIEERGGDLDKIVVARVQSSEKHPGADRLSVCQVDDGSGEPRQIVCGAKNYQVGDNVPLALPGAVLPGDFKIKKGKLRGIASDGMLCSAKELQVSADADGLWILPTDLAPGTPVAQLLTADTLFDLEVTPNRPDLLSHLGIARELAALVNGRLKRETAYYGVGTVEEATAGAVRIDDPTACPFYSARKISGVSVGPSPDWLQQKLESVGLRPINNIVDITNYVLMETGQPLHTFDAAKLDGGIAVRPAAVGEEFPALDGETYTLAAEDLVIADSTRAVAIAGVMGGEESGVTDGTTDILLEAAYFTPPHVRRTSRRLNLSSDSSYRFERGVDPSQVLGASELATKLILELAGGTAEPTTLTAGSVPAVPRTIPLDIGYCWRLLGTRNLGEGEADRILTALGLKKTSAGWEIPSYRLDLGRPIDLIEEIARVYGLDKIPTNRTAACADISLADTAYDFALGLKNALAARGFYEAQTIKLIADGQLADSLSLRPGVPPVRLKNPLSDDHTTLRPSILPGLLNVASRNTRMGAKSLRLFETGTVFFQEKNGTGEEDHLTLLMAGEAAPAAWCRTGQELLDLFDLRGLLAALAPGLSLTATTEEDPSFVLCASVSLCGKGVGRIAQLSPARARDLDIQGTVAVAELSLPALQHSILRDRRFEELPRFPSVTRDIAMELPQEFPNSELASFFRSSEEPLLTGAEIFDVFVDKTGEKLASGKKSVAYSLTYRDSGKTLTTEEADAAHGRVLEQLKKTLPAQIR